MKKSIYIYIYIYIYVYNYIAEINIVSQLYFNFQKLIFLKKQLL